MESTDAKKVFDKEENSAFTEWDIKSTERRITEYSHEERLANLRRVISSPLSKNPLLLIVPKLLSQF